MVIHVAVRSDSADSGEFHSVGSHNLAEWVLGIQRGAFLGKDGLGVNESGFIDVSGSEFDGVNIIAIIQSTSLPDTSDESTADIAVSVFVHPSVLFNLGHKFRESGTSFSSNNGKFGDSESLGTQSHVHGSTEDGVSFGGHDLLENGEHSREEFRGEDGGEAGVGGIDPSEEEVVETVGHAFHGLEPISSSGGVELLGILLFQGEPGDVVVSIMSVLHPFRELVSLDTLLRPVSSIVGLNDVEFTVDTEGND